jgi:MFS superfamily sulfate permease-like transporter
MGFFSLSLVSGFLLSLALNFIINEIRKLRGAKYPHFGLRSSSVSCVLQIVPYISLY